MSRGEDLAGEVRVLRQAAGRELPEDRNAIERLQYAYGYFIDNRMFRQMVQQPPLITVAANRQRAWSRARAQVQGNSPPGTPHFLPVGGICESECVRKGGRWKIP